MTIKLSPYTASIRPAPTSRGRWGKWKRLTRSEETMSVEIEVGLENAAKVKVPPPEALPLRPLPPASGLRGWLIIGGIIIVLAIAALFFYYHNRESTDDAQVD